MKKLIHGEGHKGEAQVLVVGNAASQQESIVYLLRDLLPSLEIVAAENSQQAFRILSERSINLLLLQWKIAARNQLELLTRIQDKEQWCHIPTVVYAEEMISIVQLEQVLASGVIDFIRKPTNSVELATRIKCILYQEQLKQQQQAIVEQNIQTLERETNNQLLLLARKNELLLNIQQLCKMTKTPSKEFQRKLSRLIEQSIGEDDYWDDFLNRLNQIDPKFVQRLSQKYPLLSKSELKVCALIRFGLDNKNIANLLQISGAGIKKSRYRIRKKLSLEHATKLNVYLKSI